MVYLDLNYRVDLQDADVRDLIASNIGGEVKTLLKYDQVSRHFWPSFCYIVFTSFWYTA